MRGGTHCSLLGVVEDTGEIEKRQRQKHRNTCNEKLQVLIEQRKDLSESIDQLLEDLSKGEKKMKVYKQMKMYNDETLNPVLYNKDE